MNDQPPPPELRLELSTDNPRGHSLDRPPAYTLSGFDELDRWGRANHAFWADLNNQAYFAGLGEMDRLRLLAGEMLRFAVARERVHHEQALTAAKGVRLIVPNEPALQDGSDDADLRYL